MNPQPISFRFALAGDHGAARYPDRRLVLGGHAEVTALPCPAPKLARALPRSRSLNTKGVSARSRVQTDWSLATALRARRRLELE